MRQVLEDLEKAVAITPEYNLAHAVLSWSYNVAIANGVYDDDESGFKGTG